MKVMGLAVAQEDGWRNIAISLIGGCSVLILKPLDISPTILGNVRRQETCPGRRP
jgi:hypothetical protein